MYALIFFFHFSCNFMGCSGCSRCEFQLKNLECLRDSYILYFNYGGFVFFLVSSFSFLYMLFDESIQSSILSEINWRTQYVDFSLSVEYLKDLNHCLAQFARLSRRGGSGDNCRRRPKYRNIELISAIYRSLSLMFACLPP